MKRNENYQNRFAEIIHLSVCDGWTDTPLLQRCENAYEDNSEDDNDTTQYSCNYRRKDKEKFNIILSHDMDTGTPRLMSFYRLSSAVYDRKSGAIASPLHPIRPLSLARSMLVALFMIAHSFNVYRLLINHSGTETILHGAPRLLQRVTATNMRHAAPHNHR